MLWGVLSDIHSNIEALKAVLARLAAERAGGYICCGDIVGYGAEPNEAIALLRELPALHAVRGNHDLAAIGLMDLAWFNESAQAAALYTRDVLSVSSRRWLEGLPEHVETKSFCAAHGSPRNPAEEYLLTSQQFLDNLAYFKASPCFVGHTHLPVCFLMKEPFSRVEEGRPEEGQGVQAPKGVRAIFNPGSVGQPRDHDPRASCGVYDDVARVFRLLRVEYDVAGAQAKILKAGLPEFLALRLGYGQ